MLRIFWETCVKRHVNKAEAEARTGSVNHLPYKHSCVMFMFNTFFPAKEEHPHKSQQVLSNMDKYHPIKPYLN